MTSIVDGVVIGGAGGAVAGLTVWLVQFAHEKVNELIESRRIYKWLKKNTTDVAGDQFRSCRVIASWNNLTQDRVRVICSSDKRIFLCINEQEDNMWGIYGHERKSVYEERGMRGV